VAVRIPVSRIASREEQRALAGLAAPGRSYHMGGGIWFAVLPGKSKEEVKAAALRLGNALKQRYGNTCEVVWSIASKSFKLTPAALSGASPLPRDISQLIEYLLPSGKDSA
jgi:hypothetical protein